MPNDTTNTTSEESLEYPAEGYNKADPSYADLINQVIEDIDTALANRLTEEEAEDVVDGLLQAGALLSKTYDDPGNTLTLDVDEGSTSHDAIDQATVSTDDHHTRYTDEESRDAIGAALASAGNISITVDDGANTITIDTTALNEEEVDDAVAALIATDSNLTATYADGSDTLTIGLASDISATSATADEVTTDTLSVADGQAHDASETQPHANHSSQTGIGRVTLRPAGVDNPVINISQPSIGDASTIDFVADPFWVHDGSQYIAYAEVAYTDTNTTTQEKIGRWTSPAGESFSWDGLAIDEGDTHLAYPDAWVQDGTTDIRPDKGSSGNTDVTVYTASSPTGTFSASETITELSGSDRRDPTAIYHDPTVHNWGDEQYRWYIIADEPTAQEIQLWYSDAGEGDITGRAWTEHPSSPIGDRTNYNGPGGRPVRYPNAVDIMYQSAESGEGVDVGRVDTLTPSAFSQSEYGYVQPILGRARNSRDWRESASHHVDLQGSGPVSKPLALADYEAGADSPFATGNRLEYNIGLFEVGDRPRVTHAYIDNSGSDQSIGTSGFVTIAYDGIEYDYGGHYDFSNNQWVAPESGYYKFDAYALLDARTITGTRIEWQIYNKDDSDAPNFRRSWDLNDAFQSVGVSGPMYCNAGDRIIVRANNFASSAIPATSGNGVSIFTVQKLNP